MEPDRVVRNLTRLATYINAYFIVAFVFADVFTSKVMGFSASYYLLESLRFFGITTLIIVTIHSLVASRYPPETMLREASWINAVYYFVFAIALWNMMPNGLWMVRLHTLLMVSCFFFFFAFLKKIVF
jgi:hypothetical protein